MTEPFGGLQCVALNLVLDTARCVIKRDIPASKTRQGTAIPRFRLANVLGHFDDDLGNRVDGGGALIVSTERNPFKKSHSSLFFASPSTSRCKRVSWQSPR